MEKKNKNILSIVLLSLSLVGVVGAAAAITKGFSEFPDIVLSSSEETVTHVEENPSQQEETFEIVDVSEIYGKLYLKDIYGATSKQVIDLNSEKLGEDTILKYRTKTFDLFYDEEHDNNLNLSEYKWGFEVGYILKNGHVFKGLYGLNKDNPTNSFPETALYGYYSEIIFSLNGLVPDNGLSVCSTIKTKEDGKIFIMSSEDPDLITSWASINFNNSTKYLSVSEQTYPVRPDYTVMSNAPEEEIQLSVEINERRGGSYYSPTVYFFDKNIHNSSMVIDNSNGEYEKFYIVISTNTKSDVYLDELVATFQSKCDDYKIYIYIYGQYTEIPEPIAEAPDHAGHYKISFSNKEIAEYCDSYGTAHLIGSVHHPGQISPASISKTYFKLNSITTYQNGSIIDTIDNISGCSRTALEFWVEGSNIIPQWGLINEFDSCLYVGLNNSENTVYEIDLVISHIDSEDCFNSFFINHYEELEMSNSYTEHFNQGDYLLVDIKSVTSNKTIGINYNLNAKVIETDNVTINTQIQRNLNENYYLNYYVVGLTGTVHLHFTDGNESGSNDKQISGIISKFTIYVNGETGGSIEYLDNEGFSQTINRREDLKIKSNTEYVLMFSSTSTDLDYEQLIYSSETAYASIYVEDGNYDEDYSYFEEGDLMSFDGVYIDCIDGSYELRIEDVANSRTACWIREITPLDRYNSCYCYLTTSGEDDAESHVFISFKNIANVQIYEAGEDW